MPSLRADLVNERVRFQLGVGLGQLQACTRVGMLMPAGVCAQLLRSTAMLAAFVGVVGMCLRGYVRACVRAYVSECGCAQPERSRVRELLRATRTEACAEAMDV
eukprot:6190816-Pleurochrysis_carterae.AAC.2